MRKLRQGIASVLSRKLTGRFRRGHAGGARVVSRRCGARDGFLGHDGGFGRRRGLGLALGLGRGAHLRQIGGSFGGGFRDLGRFGGLGGGLGGRGGGVFVGFCLGKFRTGGNDDDRRLGRGFGGLSGLLAGGGLDLGARLGGRLGLRHRGGRGLCGVAPGGLGGGVHRLERCPRRRGLQRHDSGDRPAEGRAHQKT